MNMRNNSDGITNAIALAAEQYNGSAGLTCAVLADGRAIHARGVGLP